MTDYVVYGTGFAVTKRPSWWTLGFGIVCFLNVRYPSVCLMLKIAWRRLNRGLVICDATGMAQFCTKTRIKMNNEQAAKSCSQTSMFTSLEKC